MVMIIIRTMMFIIREKLKSAIIPVINTIQFVEVSHVNKLCILGLETYLVESSRSAFYPFLR